MNKGPNQKSNPILKWDPAGSEPESPDPNSPTFIRDFKSFVRKILLVNPYFPRFTPMSSSPAPPTPMLPRLYATTIQKF